ncbi:MAG: MFS transporter [Clostridiales bacterium]|nr:MFS transporter [Clostridiales bacterium]
MFAKEASSKFKRRAFIFLIIGFITMYFSGCFGTDIINVVQNPIMEKLGCTATQAVLGWTIGGYSVILLSFFFSTIIMKKGVREFATACFVIMAVGALLVGVGYNIGGGAGSALIIVGGFLLKNFLMGLQVSVFQVVALWFNQTRGFVLGLMGAAFALDNATSSTGLSMLYNGLGFTNMMMVAAAILVALGIVTYLFVRTTPQELGLTPDGLPEQTPAGGQEEQGAQEFQSKWTLGKLLKLKESWAIMLGIGVFNLTLAAVISQFFNSLMSMGLELSTCSLFMLIFGILGIVMSPIYGKLVDVLSAPRAGVVCAILYLVSVAGFAFQIPIVAALGLTFFVGSPVIQPALTIHVFGGREYQAANRYLSIVINLIAACGIPFMTIFYDATGSYQMAYYVLLALNVAALVLMLTCNKTYGDD